MTPLRVLLMIAAIGCGSTARDAGPTGPPGAGQAAVPAGEEAVAAAPRAFRVEVSGTGPPVILIPGLASSGETWATTVARLRGRYACHVLTLAGFAGVPPIEGQSLSAVEAELTRYIESHRMVKPVIIGHSLGGTLAMMLAADRPELVGPLVIVDSLPFLGMVLSAATAEEAKPTIERIRTAMAAQTQDEHEAVVRSGRMTNSMATAAADQQRLISWGWRRIARRCETPGSRCSDWICGRGSRR
jgi:pimeloyl-ACP methyl ester carboxylesterase